MVFPPFPTFLFGFFLLSSFFFLLSLLSFRFLPVSSFSLFSPASPRGPPARSAPDVDMVKIHGYGFPRWRGGPMHAAKTMGDAAIRYALKLVSEQSAGSWTIARRYRDK